MAGQAPDFLIQSAELLFEGSYARRGFDLEITGLDGTILIVADYFSFNPPPNLMLANGNGLSPEMVKSLLHDRFDGVMFAGPAESPPVLEQIGVVRFASGNVVRKNAVGEEALEKGDPIYEGDEIIVEGRGYLVATMNDGTRFTQGANSRTTLENFEFNETAKTGSFEAKIIQGGFSYKSGKIGTFAGNSRDHTKISTPSAVIRVRGSELEGTVNATTGETVVVHKSGFLTVTDQNDNNPVVLDTPNNATMIINGGVPSNAGPASPAQIAAIQQALPPAQVIDQVEQEDTEQNQDEGEDAPDEAPTETNEPEPEASADNTEATDPDANSEDAVDEDAVDEDAVDEDETTDEDATDDETTDDETTDETSDETTDDQVEAGNETTGDEAGDGTSTDDPAADSQNTDDQTTDEQAADDQGTDDAATDDAATDEGGDDQTTDDQSASDQNNEQASNDQTSNDAAANDQSGDSQSGDGQSPDGSSDGSADGSADGSTGGDSQADQSGSDGSSASGSNGASQDSGSSDQSSSGQSSSGSTSSSSTATDSGLGATSGSDTGGSTGTGSSTDSATTSGTNTSNSGSQTTNTGTETTTTTETAPELPPDNPPTSEDDAVTVAENSTTEIGSVLLENDEDPDANQTPLLSAISVTNTNGSVTFDESTQQLSYTASGEQFDSLAAGETATDTFQYTITSAQFSSSSTVTITIEGQNDPTNAVDDNYATNGGIDLTVDAANGLLANDSDVDTSDTLTVIDATVTSDDATEIVVNADGSFEFRASNSTALNQLASGETFTSTVVYTVQSSAGDTTTATANIVVTGVNTAPTTVADTASTTEDASVTVSPLANDSDIDGDTLVLSNATVVGGSGTVTIVDNDIVFTPTTNLAEDASSTEQITYTTSDGELTSTGTVSITITGVNDPPEIQVQTVADIPEVEATSGPTDITNQVLAVVGDDSPGTEVTALDTSGTVGNVVLGSVIYDAGDAFKFLNVGETFTDSFGFTATDIKGLKSNGQFSITIQGVADAPVVSGPVSFSQTEDDGLVVLNLLTNASDPDTTDVLSVSNVVLGGNSDGLTVSGNNLNLDPNAYTSLAGGSSEVITLSYDITDTTGLVVAQTGSVSITGVNDAPVVTPIALSFSQTDPLFSGDFLQGATDIEGDVLNVANLTVVSGLSGGISTVGSALSLDPGFYNALDLGESEVVTYSYDVIDGNGGVTPNTLSVTITGTNDAPSSQNTTVVASEDVALALTAADFFFFDIDSSDTLQQVRIDNLPSLGSLQLNGVNLTAGQSVSLADINSSLLTYTSALNGNGTGYASFSFSVSDGTDFSSSNILTIDVLPVNDAPVTTPATLNVLQTDAIVNGNFNLFLVPPLASDVDGDALAINAAGPTLISGLDTGSTIVGTAISFDPSVYTFLGAGETEVIVYSYQVEDGNGGFAPGTFTITVTGTNDAPTSINTSVSLLENTPVTLTAANFAFIDVDTNDLLQGVRINSVPSFGTLQLNSVNVTGGQVVTINDINNGLLVYTPGLNGNGVAYDGIDFSVFDGTDFSTNNSVSFDVTPVNDDPIVGADNFSVPFNGTFTATLGVDDLLLNDSDPQGDPLTVTLTPVVDVTSGSLSLNSDGTFTYGTSFNLTGVQNFTYEATDGNGGSATGVVTLTIIGGPNAVAFASGDFSDPTIYTGGFVPGPADDLFIDSGVTVDLTSLTASPATLLAVDIDGSGGQLDIDSVDLNVTNTITMGSGSGLTVRGGSIAIGSSFSSDGFFVLEDSDLTAMSYSNFGVLEVSGGLNTLDALTGSNENILDVLGVAAFGSTELALVNNFDNNATITLENQSGSTRNISITSGGTFLNTDTIAVLTGSGAGGTKTIDVTTFVQAGNVAVDSTENLIINAMTTQLSSDSTFDGTGVVEFIGTQTIDVDATGWVIDSLTAPIDLSGNITISGAGMVSIDMGGGRLVLTGDTVTAGLDVQGELDVEGGTSTISSATYSNTIGTTTIRGISASSLTTLAFTMSSANAGLLFFDNAFTSARTLTLDSTGSTFTNVGAIQTGNSGGGGGTKNINADTFDNEIGGLNVLSGDTLDINANTTIFGTGTGLIGLGTISLNGTQTLNLTSDFTVSSSHGPIDLDGIITVTGPGVLIIDSGAEFVLRGDTVNADITNNGTLIVIENTSAINSGTMINTGTLSIRGTNASSTVTLNVANGFDNTGVVELDNTFTSARTVILDVASGLFLNDTGAVINSESTGGGGGDNRIQAEFTNDGTLNVNSDTTITGGPFITRDGTINIGSGNDLEINTASTKVGGNTALTGTGTITLAGAQSVDVTDGFTLLSSAPTLVTAGTIDFIGGTTFTIDTGAFLTLTADTISANLDNQGTITFENSGNTVSSSTLTTTGTLSLKGVGGSSSSSVTISNAFLNSAGAVIEIDNTFTSPRTLNFDVGLFTNDGTIQTENTGGGGGSYTLSGSGTILQRGALIANHSLTVTGTEFNTGSGTTFVANLQTLNLASTTVRLGLGSNITGSGTVEFSGPTVILGNAFDVSSSSPGYDFSGFVSIDVGGPASLNITPTGILTFTADTVNVPLNVSGILNIEENNTQINGAITTVAGGQINIRGTSAASAASLTSANGFNNVAGAMIELDNAFSSAGNLNLGIVTGTLTNDGDIKSANSGTGGGSFSVSGQVINNGSVTVDHDLTINGGSFDNTLGTVNFLSDQLLALDSTAVTLGAASNLTGVGTIQFNGPTVTLSTSFDVDAAVPNLEFAGFLTIDGTGPLNVLSGGLIALTNDTVTVDVANDGDIFIEEGTTTIQGSITANTGNITVLGTMASSNSELTVTTAFTNAGQIILDNGHTSARTLDFNISAGALTNTGTVITSDSGGGGGTYTINAEIVNGAPGVIDIDHDTTINAATFDIQDGTVNVATAVFLDVNASETNITNAATLVGDGAIKFIGVQSINLNSNFSITPTTVDFDFAGDITVVGESILTIDSGAALFLTADTVDANLVNDGNLNIQDSTNLINSATFSNTGTTVLEGSAVSTNSDLTVANAFTNTGTLTLDNQTTFNRNINLNFSSTFVNSNQLTVQNLGAGNGNFIINVTGGFTNDGVFDVNESVILISAAGSSNGAGGQINIAPSQSLDIDVSLFQNDGTITLLGGLSGTNLDLTDVTTFDNTNGTITGTGTVINSAAISGGTVTVSPGASPGVLTFDGGLNTSLILETELEGLTPGSGYDQVVVNGVANLGSSVMDVILLNGYMPEIGDSYIALTSDSLTGHFGQVSGLDIATDRVLEITYVGGDVVLTSVATTAVGDASANIITGSASQDIVVAGAGDDSISVGSGADIVFAQDGDDVIEVDDDFSRVDGGAGIDRLMIDQINEDDGARIDDIEVIDIGSGQASMNATTIAEISPEVNGLNGLENSLVLDGQASAIVTLVGDFTFDRSEQFDSGLGLTHYDVYLDGSSSIFISQGVLVAHQAVIESDQEGASIDLSGVEALALDTSNSQTTDSEFGETNLATSDMFGTEDPLASLLANLQNETVEPASQTQLFAEAAPMQNPISFVGLQDELLPLDQQSEL